MPRAPKTKRTDVGQRLFGLRQAKGLTQKQLAEKIGVSQQDIAFWERQAPAPRGEVLPKLAEAFGVSVDELLGVRPLKKVNGTPRGKLGQVFEQVSQLPRRQQQKVIEMAEGFLALHEKDS